MKLCVGIKNVIFKNFTKTCVEIRGLTPPDVLLVKQHLAKIACFFHYDARSDPQDDLQLQVTQVGSFANF